MTASGQNHWPPTSNHMTAHGQDLMAADTLSVLPAQGNPPSLLATLPNGRGAFIFLYDSALMFTHVVLSFGFRVERSSIAHLHLTPCRS